MERWRQQQAQRAYAQPQPQHGYQQPHAYPQHAPADQAYGGQHAQGGYVPAPHADPHAAMPRNPFEPTYREPAPAHGHHSQFAPQFERFAPVPPAHEPPPSYEPHALQGGAREPVLDPFHAHRNQPQHFDPHHGYGGQQGQQSDPYPPHDHYPAQHDARTDPQSWDLSHYQPGQIPQGYQNGQYPGHEAHHQPEWGGSQQGAHNPHWQQVPPQGGQGHWPGQEAGLHGQSPHHGGYDSSLAGQYPHQFEPPFDHDGNHHAAQGEGEEYEPVEEGRRGSRVVMVAGILVGAIVAGAGLAVAYKYVGRGTPSVKVAEIKRHTAPEKVRPDDPGGKTIEHSGNKFLNRNASDGSGSDSRQSEIDGSSKRVATIPIVVNRDGSYTPQASTASVPAPESQGGTSGVPGLVLDGFGPPPAAASQPPPQLRGVDTEPQQASRLPPPPPVVRGAPQRVAEVSPPRVSNAPPVTAAVETAEPPRRASQRQRDDLLAANAPASASALGNPPRKPAPSISHSGFVAVLASKRSRQEALNAFADLHSQYPDILSKVTPDVREANLGNRGVWYRVIGGPPGSKESAHELCTKLKARGMKDCWPVAY